MKIVDGRSLLFVEEFSNNISSYIKEKTDGFIAIMKKEKKENLNIMFEIGVAIGANKKLILISEDVEKIPSMLNSYNFIDCKIFNDQKLKNEIEKFFMSKIMDISNINSIEKGRRR